MDEVVIKFVSATGFAHFEKGILWHERMLISLLLISFLVLLILLFAVTNYLEQVFLMRERRHTIVSLNSMIADCLI